MKTLIYIPLLYRNEMGLWPPTCPNTWYFKWQKELYEFFKTLPIKVIWKAGRRSFPEDPIRDWRAKNIRYSIRKLERELKKADFALVDFPSTPMFDAINAGLSTVCLTTDWDLVRDDYGRLTSMFGVDNIKHVKDLIEELVLHGGLWPISDNVLIPCNLMKQIKEVLR